VETLDQRDDIIAIINPIRGGIISKSKAERQGNQGHATNILARDKLLIV
jgi:hypothetical protein